MVHRLWATDEYPAGCSKRPPSSKAAASEEARRTLRYVESLSDARTMLATFQHPAVDSFNEVAVTPKGVNSTRAAFKSRLS